MSEMGHGTVRNGARPISKSYIVYIIFTKTSDMRHIYSRTKQWSVNHKNKKANSTVVPATFSKKINIVCVFFKYTFWYKFRQIPFLFESDRSVSTQTLTTEHKSYSCRLTMFKIQINNFKTVILRKYPVLFFIDFW